MPALLLIRPRTIGLAFAAAFALTALRSGADDSSAVSHAPSEAVHRGVWEGELRAGVFTGDPFFDAELQVTFTRPDGSTATTGGYYKGDARWGFRAYCAVPGRWTWRTESNVDAMNGVSGAFDAAPSEWPGKLRLHPDDKRQFAYDSGDWFLHLGDTGYRYAADSEPLWREYIDEAAAAGFTKIRVWFCRGRSDIAALFTDVRDGLNLPYWDEIDRRLLYALERHPHLQIQLIPFGEDGEELLRYGQGDRASRKMAEYAQARFSALPNVQWCIVNDIGMRDRNSELAKAVDAIGHDMAAREPWGTLLTTHQKRFEGYAFVDAEWSDIVTLQDRDQIDGRLLLEYRTKSDGPVVLDEDRYGIYLSPVNDRYFFRRLMWASLLSGGHATYGGLETYLPFDGPEKTRGVQGYATAVADGRLDDGAHDFPHIRRFFEESGVTLVAMTPNDALAGGDGRRVKVIADAQTLIAYLANPDNESPEQANAADSPAHATIHVPEGRWTGRWFHPATGAWIPEGMTADGGKAADFVAPFEGDAVLLLQRETEP